MAMTVEQFELITTTAMRMVTLIEWVDFPFSVRSQAAADVPDPTGREMLTKLAGDKEFQSLLRAVMRDSFASLKEHLSRLSGHQEIEQEAAGLINSAFKIVLRLMVPTVSNLAATPMRIKFRNLEHPLVQAPVDVVVPSVQEQLSGHKPYRPSIAN